jgi:hypothetical protein
MFVRFFEIPRRGASVMSASIDGRRPEIFLKILRPKSFAQNFFEIRELWQIINCKILRFFV